MFDLKKLERNNAIFWAFTLPDIRRVASECGWAVGVHGSLVNDLDLMAMPWVERHTTADELARRINELNPLEYRRDYDKSLPGQKPNHRTVYTLYMGQTYIDMNVIDMED